MKNTLKQELQAYFDRIFPDARIEDRQSIVSNNIHLRFELGGELKNGTIKRVNQATERALTIFNDAFQDPAAEVYVLIYEYLGENLWDASNDYLHEQFPADRFLNFYSELEEVDLGNTTTDESGNVVLESGEVRIIVGKLAVGEINARNILNGIANCEMGFDPKVDQSVYFFDPSTDRAFMMYDDRGCFVFSDHADKIREIFIGRNSWIVEYHRKEIEKYFA